MATFLALYRGDTIADAKLVTACADPTIVADFARRLLPAALPSDPVLLEVERGRRRALRVIIHESEEIS
jgi:hypothetical protein